MKVCILGAKGQIGSELRRSISNDSKSYSSSMPDVKIYELTKDDFDFKDFDKLKTAIYDFSPNAIINAAAYTDVDQAEDKENEAYEINSKLPRKLGKLCTEIDAMLVHISTDYVFDGKGKKLLDTAVFDGKSTKPYTEEDNVGPIGVYGKSKLDGEENIRKFCKRHIILRTAWVFGDKGKNFVKTMINLGSKQDEVSVVEDQIGSPTSAISISNVISKIIFKMHNASLRDKRWGTYHFCGFPYVSWADFASEIFEQANIKGLIKRSVKVKRINSSDLRPKAKRPQNSMLECKKIELNFELACDNWKKSLDILLSSWVIKNG